MQPDYIVFAGINGAGKTTLYKSNLWKFSSTPSRLSRVNPDEIIRDNGLNPESQSDQLEAGKIAVNQIRRLFEKRNSFTHETVFAGKTSIKRIEEAKRRGYRVVLNYVGLKDTELAIERITRRVEVGGHNIDPELVKKRWASSLNNLAIAKQICDFVNVFDNTDYLKEIAAWDHGTLCWWGASKVRGEWLLDSLLDE
ncbi:MAG: zeta toxin family protein [Phoenicibacter congonensis]|uniref:UDP-N-acetylglucosamine kinase n=1 Tax=Phoenicibacter congonensis TaxID=1944646 RepID=A0AA43RKR9_9ACTN|nr:zeta toxin family protein [Phoenicibacter congonensis]